MQCLLTLDLGYEEEILSNGCDDICGIATESIEEIFDGVVSERRKRNANVKLKVNISTNMLNTRHYPF